MPTECADASEPKMDDADVATALFYAALLGGTCVCVALSESARREAEAKKKKERRKKRRAVAGSSKEQSRALEKAVKAARAGNARLSREVSAVPPMPSRPSIGAGKLRLTRLHALASPIGR